MEWASFLSVLFTLLPINIYHLEATVLRARYVETSDCILDSNCSKKDNGYSRSQIECAAYCGRDKTCSGFHYATANKLCTCLHGDCFSTSTCDQGDLDARLFKRKNFCYNGGKFDDTLRTCICSGGWVGEHCERLPYTCEELRTHWYPDNTYEWVKIDIFRNGSRVVNTKCFIAGKITRTYIFKSGGVNDLGRRWLEYVEGYSFGDLNFWLGLENIRAFNILGYTDVFVVAMLKNKNGDKRIWWNENINFQIEGADVGYSFTCDPCKSVESGTLAKEYKMGDLLYLSQGLPFSTFDNDNDQDLEINCAEVAHAGWWFRNYSSMNINPLGRRYQSGDVRQYVMLPGLPMTEKEIANGFNTVEMFFQTNGV